MLVLLALGLYEVIDPDLTDGGEVPQPLEMAVAILYGIAQLAEAYAPALFLERLLGVVVAQHIILRVIPRYAHQRQEVDDAAWGASRGKLLGHVLEEQRAVVHRPDEEAGRARL